MFIFEHFLCIKELQYTYSPSSFSELTPSQDLDEDKIAAFVARTRGYKYGYLTKSSGLTPDLTLFS